MESCPRNPIRLHQSQLPVSSPPEGYCDPNEPFPNSAIVALDHCWKIDTNCSRHSELIRQRAWRPPVDLPCVEFRLDTGSYDSLPSLDLPAPIHLLVGRARFSAAFLAARFFIYTVGRLRIAFC